MKIGIVTFHCAYNFGSALQTFAMKRAVERLDNSVCVIDYRGKDFNQYHIVRPLRPWKMLKTPASYRALIHRKSAFQTFWRNHFNLTRKYSYMNEASLNSLTSEFDCFICGSDQIWNLDCTRGVVAPFFLSFAGDKRRVAYAPSLAHTSFKPENFDKEKVSSLLSKFDHLSVREQETLPLFQPLVDKPFDVVLDPTLLLTASDYADMTVNTVVDGKYAFLYLLRDCPELIDSACQMASDTGIRFVYVSERDLPIPNSINLFGIGPSEFVSLIAHASFVLTNSFHATVFSVLFHKSFRVYATDKSGARMRDLLSELGIGECCVSFVCSDVFPQIDWAQVDSSLEALREHSWQYLRKALE